MAQQHQQNTQAAGSSQPDESQKAVEAVWRYELSQLSDPPQCSVGNLAPGQALQAGKTRLDPRTDHIYVIHYLKGRKSEQKAEDLFMHLSRVVRRPNQSHIDAAWDGWMAIQKDVATNLRLATNDGKLLKCWEGSTVVNLPQGGAA